MIIGVGSTWTNTDELTVGEHSKGAMIISDGGSVSNINGYMGGAGISGEGPNILLLGNGVATVTGAGSTWTNSGELNVGFQGTGTLTIEDGAIVTSANAFVGRLAGTLVTGNPFYEYSSTGEVTVTGTGSKWTINGSLSMGGDVTTNTDGGAGTLTIGPGSAVNVAQHTVLFTNGTVKLEGGSFATTSFDFQGGQFQWASGTLHIDTFDGSLTNPTGGTLAPGRSAGSTMITGNYTQQSGAALEIEIGGTAISMHDFVSISGTALVDGELQLKLIDSFFPAATDTFTVLNALGGIAGVFSNVTTGQRLTTADGGGSFLVHYGATSIFNPNQIVLTAFEASPPPLLGDYNQNGTVDAADFVLWRKNLGGGTSLPNDDTPGIGPDDYTRWRTSFGRMAGSNSGAITNAAVPEPTAIVLFVGALVALSIANARQCHTPCVDVQIRAIWSCHMHASC